MAKLYMRASFCFDIALYLWIYMGYIDYEGPLFIIVALVFFVSLLLLALPSGYYIRGFNIHLKRVDLLGYLKMLQLFTFFVLMPALGKDKIIITLLILVIASIISWANQIKVHKQIREQVSYEKIVNKMLNQTEKDIQNDILVGVAWKTILPLLLWGFMAENHTIMNLLICIVILLICARLIYKLYINLIKHLGSTAVKKDFYRTLIRVIIAMVVLIVMSVVQPTNLFNYVILGFIPLQFVNLIYRHTLDQNKRLDQQQSFEENSI